MALPTASPAPPASPQLIGNAFVQQYYHILHQQPESVHKFYQDSSILSRPNPDGLMTSVTTMQAINDIILSLDFNNCFTEIETVDSQISYKEGVLIIVTGSFTGKDNVRRKFTESFFLAPQESGGYFVLNDVFRFLNETQPRELHHMLVNGTSEDVCKASLTPELGTVTQDHAIEEAPLSDVDGDNDEEVIDPPENISSGLEDEIVVDPPVHAGESNVQPVSEVTTFVTTASVAQDDAPKKSYASIVKVMKGNPSPTFLYVPTTKAKNIPVNTEKPTTAPTKEVPDVECTDPANDNGTEDNLQEEEGHSVYIKNLPLNATAEKVEEEFKKFGSIKPGGVQVRSHKVEPFCFGFVEFVSQQSMQAAIEASPIVFGGRNAFVEKKKTTTRVVNGVVTTNGNTDTRRRFQPGRGGFRNDNFRGRGNFGANMAFRRNEFRNRVDYSGRGHRPTSRGDDGGYQRVYQNGNGRFGRPSGPKQTAVSA